MTAAPGQPGFLAVSKAGLLQTREGRKDLKKVFPSLKSWNWSAVISVGCFAVLAGASEFSFFDNGEFRKEHNYFLLVHLRTLEVVNQTHPLMVAWSQSTSVV